MKLNGYSSFFFRKKETLLAIREALSWIKELQVSDVIIESGSLLSVEAINGVESDDSYCGVVISNCKVLLSNVTAVSVMYNHRSSNMFAHNLAKAAVSLSDYFVWGGPVDYALSSALYCASISNE